MNDKARKGKRRKGKLDKMEIDKINKGKHENKGKIDEMQSINLSLYSFYIQIITRKKI